MLVSYDAHAQAVRDRQQSLRRDADLHRLVAAVPRRSLAGRLRCAAAWLRLPVAHPCTTTPQGARP
jgi:hypothetical protein